MSCTASVIDEQHILTARHCLFPKEDLKLLDGVIFDRESWKLQDAWFALGFYERCNEPFDSLDCRKIIRGIERFQVRLEPAEQNKSLDYAVLEVDFEGSQVQPVYLASYPIDLEEGDRLLMLHHPKGQPMQVSIHECLHDRSYSNASYIGHFCDTQGGSSGAPIFDFDRLDVIGLHTHGAKVGLRNTGSLMSALVKASSSTNTRHLSSISNLEPQLTAEEETLLAESDNLAAKSEIAFAEGDFGSGVLLAELALNESLMANPILKDRALGGRAALVKSMTHNRELRRILDHQDGVLGVTFDPSKRKILTFSDDETARVFAFPTGNALAEFRENDTIWHGEFDRSGNKMLTVTEGFDLSVWDLATGSQFLRFGADGWDSDIAATLPINKLGTASFARFHPTKDWIVVATEGGVLILSSVDGSFIRLLSDKGEDVELFSFDQKGTKLAAVDRDGKAYVWNLEENKLEATYHHNREVSDVKFSPNGKHVATVSDSQGIHLWNSRTGRDLWRSWLETDQPHTGTLFFSPDSSKLVLAGTDSVARVWSVEGGPTTETILVHNGPVNSADFSQLSDLLVTSSDDNIVRLWNLETGELVREFRGHTDWVTQAVFGPDEKTIVTTSEDSTVRIWNAAPSDRIASLQIQSESSIEEFLIDRNGETLAAATLGKQGLVMWNIASGKLIRHLNISEDFAGSDLREFRFLARQGLLCLVLTDRAIIYDFHAGKPLHSISFNGLFPIATLFSESENKALTVTNQKIFSMEHIKW